MAIFDQFNKNGFYWAAKFCFIFPFWAAQKTGWIEIDANKGVVWKLYASWFASNPNLKSQDKPKIFGDRIMIHFLGNEE